MGCGGSKGESGGPKGGGGKNAGGGSAKGGEKATDRKNANAENAEYQAKMKFCEQVPLLKRLPKDQHPLVAEAMVMQEFEKGAKIINQGDTGDEFFVIRAGSANVERKEEDGSVKALATLKAGDYFGENALKSDELRQASIIAAEKLTAFKITRAKFQELGLNDYLQFANRRAVGAGQQAESKAKPPSPKTQEEEQLISNALRSNENLSSITKLDDDRVKQFIKVMWKETVTSGQHIIEEADMNADYFYVVQDGSFEVYASQLEDGEEAPKGEPQVVGTVGKGGSFGELALLYFVPRAATVKATTQSTVWVIDRGNFKKILMQVSEAKLKDFATA